MVITADPKLNNYLFQQEGKKVERWYLDTFQKVFRLEGEARPNAGGRIHKYVRGSFLNLFGVDSLRTNLLSEIETTIRTNIHRWSTQGTIDAKREAAYKVFRLEGEARPNAGGRIHKYVRGSFLNLVGVDSLRTNLLSEIETTIRTHIHRWSTQGTIDAKKEAAYGYAVMFLKNNTSLVLLGLAEAPATPDRVSDLGIQEMSWKDHLTEENLFYVVSPGAMETYRNSIESHLAKVEASRMSKDCGVYCKLRWSGVNKTGSCIQEEVETSMYDAAADFVSQGGAYEEDEGETSTIICLEALKMVAVFAAKNLFGQDFEKSSDVTTDTIAGFVQGLMSFPLNIPGTRFYKCMKDKDKLEKVIRAMLKERIACPEEKKGDFFDHEVKDLNTDFFLT
ncbi:hypothetical protein TEA_018461 [Camellia sinensis var. sinensis]|uniref:Uncharacterized protein n=1 Tax=Camellia sinensis var. sinensis TaxID=542762 RepID=A0A4S4CVH8_CAMSN|nr:hypothetical protein TEA_018461 [Camellia sinensis var. sinensis]